MVELTVGSKTLPTAFFVVESKGAYNVLLGRDWIHANCCVPSTMHQKILQWDGDKVEVVTADSSAHVAIADATFGECQCLSGQALEDCDFLSASKSGFKPVLINRQSESNVGFLQCMLN